MSDEKYPINGTKEEQQHWRDTIGVKQYNKLEAYAKTRMDEREAQIKSKLDALMRTINPNGKTFYTTPSKHDLSIWVYYEGDFGKVTHSKGEFGFDKISKHDLPDFADKVINGELICVTEESGNSILEALRHNSQIFDGYGKDPSSIHYRW